MRKRILALLIIALLAPTTATPKGPMVDSEVALLQEYIIVEDDSCPWWHLCGGGGLIDLFWWLRK